LRLDRATIAIACHAFDLGLKPTFLGCFYLGHRFANAAQCIIEVVEFSMSAARYDKQNGSSAVAVSPTTQSPETRASKSASEKGRFCGHFSRTVVSDFQSLRGDIVSRSLFEAPVSDARIPVPNSNRAG
jgi:hypothetical protein